MNDFPIYIDVFHDPHRRHVQEDRFISQALFDGYVIGVFDGHNGAYVSDRAAASFTHYLASHLHNQIPIEDALGETIEQLQSDFSEETSGSTLSAAYIREERGELQVTTAQLGDSAIIIQSPGKDPIVTPEHSVKNNPADCATITAFINDAPGSMNQSDHRHTACISGGYLWLGDSIHGSGLAVTRALGDRYFTGLLIREPVIKTISAPINSVVIACTDGVHTYTDPEAEFRRYREIGERALAGDRAEQIGLSILSDKKTRDNLTLVIWRPAEDLRPIKGSVDFYQNEEERIYALWQELPEDIQDRVAATEMILRFNLVHLEGNEQAIDEVTVLDAMANLQHRYQLIYYPHKHNANEGSSSE